MQVNYIVLISSLFYFFSFLRRGEQSTVFALYCMSDSLNISRCKILGFLF